jgi:hypothetical protein
MIDRQRTKAFETALALIQGKLIASEISKSLGALPAPAVPIMPAAPVVAPAPFPKVWALGAFGLTDQRTTVATGEEKKKVFSLKIPPLYIGVIRGVASKYFVGDDVYWEIDGKVQEGGAIHRRFGMYPNTPVVTWRVFYDKVEWFVSNNGTTSHSYGVFCDGFVGLRAEEQAFLNTVKTIS